jgi:tRNA pseudouridine55 synthase
VKGLLVVDKPGGMTSHDVVARLRKITGEQSIGHLGTLDPMATGVLPLLLGKFTRLAQYFSAAEKSYTGTIRFGFWTDTYDAEGQPAGPDLKPNLQLDLVKAAATRFDGEIEQVPPPFSAKKIAGRPAYKLARQNQPVELPPIRVRIRSFTITRVEGAEADFTVTLSAGGYVRSIAHEMGRAIGCGAHLSRLRRTQSGSFTLEDAHRLADLEKLRGNDLALEKCCVHPRSLLPEMPAVSGDEQSLGRLRNGLQANLPEFSEVPLVKVFDGQRNLVAVARRVVGTLFQPLVVMG